MRFASLSRGPLDGQIILFEFTFQPTFRENYIASLSVLRRAPVQLVAALFFPAMGVYLLAALASNGQRPSAYEGFLAVMCCAFPFGLTAFNVWLFRRRNRLAEGPYVVAFDEDGMHIRNPIVESHFKWAAVRKVVETRRHFLFFISPMMAQFVPKPAVGTNEAQAAFRAFVTNRGISFRGGPRPPNV